MPRKDGLISEAFRERLAATGGHVYWRSLDELAQTPEFQQALWREFPEQASEWNGTTSRRQFLALMAASFGLAGLAGCSREPPENIVPYVHQPEEIVPGKPLYFATSLAPAGDVVGVLVESHMGRPIKIEGNPRHPAVPAAHWGGDPQYHPGSSDAATQAQILSLYDPDRAQAVTRQGEISDWGTFLGALTTRLESLRSQQGRGLRILTDTVRSPTLAAQLQEILTAFPEAQWHQYEPVHRDQARSGANLAFGRDVQPRYHFDRADVILALDADFLTYGAGHLVSAREWMQQRQLPAGQSGQAEMSRLYVLESTPSLTGAMADHRLPLSPAQIESAAIEIARRVGVDLPLPANPADLSGLPPHWLDAVADDLQHYRRKSAGAPLVVAGAWASPHVHAVAHLINEHLQSVGVAVEYTEPLEFNPDGQVASLRALVEDLQAGRVDTLILLGTNPVYTAPADFEFAEALRQAPFSALISGYFDETAARCQWHIPEAHPLESWGDLRGIDGVESIVQPLIAPLYGGKTPTEVLAAVIGPTTRSAYDIVRQHHQQQRPADEFAADWEKALHEGIIAGQKLDALSVTTEGWQDRWNQVPPPVQVASVSGAVEVLFRPDPTVFDGRFANNGWLQELPKSLTKLTWDNAAILSPVTAGQLGLQNGEVIRLRAGKQIVEAPVWILPGQADQCVTLHLGYGRTAAGKVGNHAGFNAYQLRTSASQWTLPAVTLERTDRRHPLATTQHHALMDGRDLIRHGTLAEHRQHSEESATHATEGEPRQHHSLMPENEWKYEGHKWGMTINLNQCTGCSACVVACQAENNIPVVGKEQVLVGREMHWLRVDRYYSGADTANPEAFHQPVPCMHCEHAPCEIVCPVAATSHSNEGLNQMVYNRCVGTRYCSNNCPYKVRRFNFLQYTDYDTPVLKLLNNPDVTVRSRGVMEKCTYCIQRITEARQQAELDDRELQDGEIVTACQAACPTQAIIFGDLNDPASRVAQSQARPENYVLLEELNTRPRTSYLPAVRNPHPQLAPAKS